MNRFVVLAALVCVVGMGMGVEYAAAEPTAPKLRAKLRKKDDSVRINWRTRKLDRQIERIDDLRQAQGLAAPSEIAADQLPGDDVPTPAVGDH